MGFRIDKGVFQFLDNGKYISRFKINEVDGRIVEVDPETNDPVDTYLKSSEKAADSNLLDGVDSSAFLRSNTADTASARIDFTADESIRFKGARGQFTNEYIHLYNKVGIGHPNGWGQGQSDTPDKGISTYGGANFAYGNNAQSSFKGSLRVDANWGSGSFSEAFTIRGTYPSIALRSTTHDSKWLIHNDNNVSWYYGSAVDTADWGLKFRIATNGNIWMSWAGGWLSDLLNAKSDSDHNHSTIYAGHGYINSSDWNTFASPHGTDSTFGGGIYRVESSAANPPASGVYNWSLYQQGNTSRGSQIAVGAYAGGNRLFFRGSNQTAGAYRNWAEVWHTDNFDPTATINEAKEDLLNGAIATAQTTADNAATAAASATTTANTAVDRADSTKLALVELTNSLGTAAYTASTAYLGATAKAADANLLDGIDSSRFVFGGNATKTTNVSNFTTALSSGFYDAYNTTGTPTGTWYTMINMRHNNTGNNYGSQIAVSFYSNADMFVRTISNGSYQGWSRIWNEANFDPSTKLGVTAKAADADKLDGYDWMQSGKSVRANEFYADGWLRNYNSGKGLYNEATGQHFYSDDDDYWNVAGGTVANGIRFRDEHGGTIRGYVYADNGNSIGLLDAGGNWGVRHINDNGTYFYTDNNVEEFKVGRDAVTGNYGTVQTSTTRGSWGGYSIAGRVVFMHDHSNGWGIYNDVNNEWMVYGTLNGQVELKYNNATKIATNSGGVTVTGTCTATAFSGDGSALTNLPIPDQGTPFTDATRGTNTTLASMTFDGRSMIFTMANGTSFVIDGARPNG